jgi:hypothetical protein
MLEIFSRPNLVGKKPESLETQFNREALERQYNSPSFEQKSPESLLQLDPGETIASEFIGLGAYQDLIVNKTNGLLTEIVAIAQSEDQATGFWGKAKQMVGSATGAIVRNINAAKRDAANGLFLTGTQEAFGRNDIGDKFVASNIYDNQIEFIKSQLAKPLQNYPNFSPENKQKIDNLLLGYKADWLDYSGRIANASDSKAVKTNYGNTFEKRKGIKGDIVKNTLLMPIFGAGMAGLGIAGAGLVGVRSLINGVWTEKKRQDLEVKKIEKKEIGAFGDTIVTEFGQTYSQPLPEGFALENANSVGEVITYMETYNLELDPVISDKMMQIFPAFAARIDNFEITGVQAASIKKLNSTIFNLSLKQNTIQDSNSAIANQKVLEFLNKIEAQFTESAQKLENDEFKQNTKNEAKKGWQLRMGLGLAVGAGAFGLGWVARKYAPDAINSVMETFSGKNGQVKIGEAVAVSSHAPAPTGLVLIREGVGDLNIYGPEGTPVPTDEQITNAITEQALNLPIDANNPVTQFQNLKGVFKIKPDNASGNDLKFIQEKLLSVQSRIVTKGDSGKFYGVDVNRDGVITSDERLSVIGRYKPTGELVVASKDAPQSAIDALNNDSNIEKYATLTNQPLPASSEFTQPTFVVPFGTPLNPANNPFAAPLPNQEPLNLNTLNNPDDLTRLQNALGNNAATNTPLPGSDLAIRNSLTGGDGIINSDDISTAKLNIGVQLESLRTQLSNNFDPTKAPDPNFNQLGVMAKVTQLNSLKQELENLKPGQTIKLSDNLDFNLIGKDGSVGVSSNTLARVANLTDAKKLGINDNIITSDERTNALELVKNNLRDLKKIEKDPNLSTADKTLVSQKIKELAAIRDGLNSNVKGGTIQEVNGRLSFKGSNVAENSVAPDPKLETSQQSDQSLLEKPKPNLPVVAGDQNLASGLGQKMSEEITANLGQTIDRSELPMLMKILTKYTNLNTKDNLTDANLLQVITKLDQYFQRNSRGSIRIDGVGANDFTFFPADNGGGEAIVSFPEQTATGNQPAVPNPTSVQPQQPPVAPTTANQFPAAGRADFGNQVDLNQTTPVLPADQAQPTVPRVQNPAENTVQPARPVQPQISQPQPTTKGELLGFNTTDLSQLNDATSRGGIGKLEIYAFDKDPNSPFNQMAARLRMSPEDTKAFVAVNGLYEKDGQLYTGVELKNTLIQKIQTGEIKPQDISTPEGINRVIQSYGIKSEGGMGVGVYGGNSADLAQAKAYFADVEALNQQFAREGKLILNPNDYRETTFNPNSPTATTDEADYGRRLAEIRTRNLRTVFGRGSEWQTNANTADTKAIEVYDGNAITPQTNQSSAVLSQGVGGQSQQIGRIGLPLRQNQSNPQQFPVPTGANSTTEAISTPETTNNPSPRNVRLGGTTLNSDVVKGFQYISSARHNLNTNIFGNDGGNPTYNDITFSFVNPLNSSQEIKTNWKVPFSSLEDQPTLRVMPNPYGPDGNLRSGGLVNDKSFMQIWANGLQDGQTSTYYDPNNKGYELIVDAQGNTFLQIPKDATKPPSTLNFDVLVSDQTGNIKSNRVIVDLVNTAPIASGNGNQSQPNPITPPAGNGGTTPPAQPTGRTFSVAQIGDPERSDVATARESFNSNGTIDGLDINSINKDIPGTGHADLGKKNIADMTGKDYDDNWNDLRNLAYSGDAKGTEFGNIIAEIDKMIPASLSRENRVKIFNEVDTLLEGLAKIYPKDPNAQTTAEGLLNHYFNLTDGILQNANVPQTQGGNWYDYPLAFMAAGLWITAGTAVGLAQGRYAIDPRLSRPGLFRAVDSDNAVPPNQSALGNFINRTYNNPLVNRFNPRRLRLETYKDAVVSIAGLFTGPFGWGLTLGTGVARYIADRNPSEEDPQRIVGNQHFR